MSLATLKDFDQRTAEGILAAAALATAPNAELSEKHELVQRYSEKAQEVLSEIRTRLKIRPGDDSARSKVAIDTFLASALEGLILGPGKEAGALNRLGQSGRLAPILYHVVQPKNFVDTFYRLGVSASYVDDAVRRPDDFQHLMAETLPENSDDGRTISLFMKRIVSREQRNSHWLLVQTHRIGASQIAQSAWRVYPDDVDLSLAKKPLDVLRGFAEVFGCPVRVAGKEPTKFAELETFPLNTEVAISWRGAPKEHFWSSSYIRDTVNNVILVGTVYCIDIPKYRTSLKGRGVKVQEPSADVIARAPIPRTEARIHMGDHKATISYSA